MQNQDDSISRLISLKSSYIKQPFRQVVTGDSKDVKCLWSLWDQLEVQDGILKYKWLNVINDTVQCLLVAPYELRKVIFQKLNCYKSGGHFGRRRTIEAIRRRIY